MAMEKAAQRATQRLLLPLQRGISISTSLPLPISIRLFSTTASAVRSSALIAGRPVLAGAPRARLACSEAVLRRGTSASSCFRSRNGLRRYSSAKEESEVPNSRIYRFQEIKQLVETKEPQEKAILIDVREPGELLETGKIPGALNIPITTAVQSFHIPDQDFEDMYGFPRPAKDANLVFYCRAGVRAQSAAGLAQHAGWTSVGQYPGSWLDWEANKGPVEKI